MRIPTVVFYAAMAFAIVGSCGSALAQLKTSTVRSHGDIPYVATLSDTVQDMLHMAQVGEDDVVYDLGSGDGRIVIAAVRDFGARRAVGIEIDAELIQESRKNARAAGVEDRVQFIHGDLFTNDFSEATVVSIYLGRVPNIALRSKMLADLAPGSHIVSHAFGMGEWPPDKTQIVRKRHLGMLGIMGMPFSHNQNVPDYSLYSHAIGKSSQIFVWVIPAPVAGVWRGEIETTLGPRKFEMRLNQRLSKVNGTFIMPGSNKLFGKIDASLWGDHLRFYGRPKNVRFGKLHLNFDGGVQGDTMRGTMTVREKDQVTERSWEARRDKSDFTGAWEWSRATEPRPVRLRIERRAGKIAATYVDRGKEIPVPDIYDHGGGFYFTLSFGRTKTGSFRGGKESGWLIGDAIADSDALKGTIDFHTRILPDLSALFPPERSKVLEDLVKSQEIKKPPVSRDWLPRSVD